MWGSSSMVEQRSPKPPVDGSRPSFLANLIHKFAHSIGMNEGHVATCIDDNHVLWVGFKCCGCGKVFHKHASRWNLENEKYNLDATYHKYPPPDDKFNCDDEFSSDVF